MAFRFNITNTYEYRGMVTGVSAKTGRQWMSLRLEDEQAEQIEISVPSEMQGDVFNMSLNKGDLIEVSFVAVARSNGNSYVMLNALPEYCEE